jgi:four helix bundle protein
MKGDDIAERLIELDVAVLKITTRLPANSPGRHLASQLVRSGTAGGAHYEEERGVASRPDFVPPSC